MACSTSICFSASIAAPASCSSSTSFLSAGHVSSAPSVFRHHKRRRQAEAINGALAMIGLTVGLVVEGQTGKGILGQLAGYLAAISSLFGQ